MLVNVYGCGFAGIVSALGLCERGHHALGIDIDPNKVQSLLKGHFPGASDVIDALINKHLDRGLSFQNYGSESFDAEVFFVALPTPFDGKTLATEGLKSCCNHILQRAINKKPVIFIRSTLPIGGLTQIERMLELENKLVSGKDFQIYYFPEFMREGTGLDDVENPPLSVVGLGKGQPEPHHLDLIALNGRIQQVPSKEAEALKLLSNAFHAAKVTFANEAMRICDAHDVSADNVMNLFCQDTKLNISPKYLRPGFAWGGGCLGKDTKALTALASTTPLLDSLLKSNSEHIKFFSEIILEKSPATIGFVGASFKENVNDVRDSPVSALIQLCNNSPSVRQILLLDSNKELPDQLNGCDKVSFCTNVDELADAELIVCRASKYKEIKDYLNEKQTCIQL